MSGRAALGAILMVCIFSGCSSVIGSKGYECRLPQEKVERYPVLGERPEPGLFRFRGVYLSAFELSSLIVYWPEDVYEIPPHFPVSYCVLWLGSCSEEFSKMLAPPNLSGDLKYFSMIEGLAAWDPRYKDSDQVYGCIRVIGLSSIRTPTSGEVLEHLRPVGSGERPDSSL